MGETSCVIEKRQLEDVRKESHELKQLGGLGLQERGLPARRAQWP